MNIKLISNKFQLADNRIRKFANRMEYYLVKKYGVTIINPYLPSYLMYLFIYLFL